MMRYFIRRMLNFRSGKYQDLIKIRFKNNNIPLWEGNIIVGDADRKNLIILRLCELCPGDQVGKLCEQPQDQPNHATDHRAVNANAL